MRIRQTSAAHLGLLVLLPFSLVACSAAATGHDGRAGLGSSGEALAAGPPQCEPGLPHEAGKSRVDVRIADEDRQYLLSVPSGYDGRRGRALLLVLHGAGPSPDERPRSEFEFDEIWNEGSSQLPPDLIVAAPQAAGNGWDPDPYGADADLVVAVLDDVEARLCVDPDRVFATGISSGGVLVSTLACRLSDRLAAVATTIGMADPFGECEDQPAPLPIVSIIGDEDHVFRAVDVAADHASWAKNNGCDTEPRSSPVGSTSVSVTEYEGCAGGATVALYVVEGMGHKQARADCSKIPSFVRDQVCFRSDFDFRHTQFDFFEWVLASNDG